MGEQLSGDGVSGRRRGHPGDAVSDPWNVRETAALETVLAAVIRGGDLDPEAEQRAVAAFRAARHAGVHRARTRRRDDWRLRAERRAGRPVKMTFGVVFASLALGGVAVAAIGSVGSSADGADRGTAHPSAAAPDRRGGEASSEPSGGLGPTDGSATAQDTEARCRAYDQVKNRGKALDATAWQRLVAAAGGTDKVAAYCSEQLARATAAPNRPGDTGKPVEGAADAGKGTAGNTGTSGNGTSGNGTSGNDPGSADNATGNGQASGGKGSGKHK
ncbi:hypothetical protein ACFOZ0_10140 [Streptomyces yaanensis]|uniref:Uncharacterized protein n=1 Tax=Streptomyces yaanensis TaxID=1142239 RepID=A0ABV7SBD6_9ACTN|nr:hypothetical protein [Streptomyces sp. CGMCC 4.7035]WNB96709.1 hypothetical protein Q2K21_00730 [Streptomyces sp. CGMCC 4.7035]